MDEAARYERGLQAQVRRRRQGGATRPQAARAVRRDDPNQRAAGNLRQEASHRISDGRRRRSEERRLRARDATHQAPARFAARLREAAWRIKSRVRNVAAVSEAMPDVTLAFARQRVGIW